MKIYVNELPKSCASCKFCTSEYYCKLMLKNIFNYDKPINRQGKYSKCPLKSLTDYTKQVRKKVCDEIRKFYTTPIYDRENAHTEVRVLLSRLDQIQGETK